MQRSIHTDISIHMYTQLCKYPLHIQMREVAKLRIILVSDVNLWSMRVKSCVQLNKALNMKNMFGSVSQLLFYIITVNGKSGGSWSRLLIFLEGTVYLMSLSPCELSSSMCAQPTYITANNELRTLTGGASPYLSKVSGVQRQCRTLT